MFSHNFIFPKKNFSVIVFGSFFYLRYLLLRQQPPSSSSSTLSSRLPHYLQQTTTTIIIFFDLQQPFRSVTRICYPVLLFVFDVLHLAGNVFAFGLFVARHCTPMMVRISGLLQAVLSLYAVIVAGSLQIIVQSTRQIFVGLLSCVSLMQERKKSLQRAMEHESSAK